MSPDVSTPRGLRPLAADGGRLAPVPLVRAAIVVRFFGDAMQRGFEARASALKKRAGS
jgi:hypothetical protein